MDLQGVTYCEVLRVHAVKITGSGSDDRIY
jgi:hypothetical protein